MSAEQELGYGEGKVESNC